MSTALESGKTPVAAGGLNSIHKANVAAALAAELERPLFLLCPDDLEAERVAADLGAFLGETPVVLPPRELTFHTAEVVSREWENRRLDALSRVPSARVTVASYEAAAARTLPYSLFDKLAITLKPGDTVNLDSLCDSLVAAGYKRSPQVEGAGQFSVRGGILDFFSPGMESPCRAELWGDEIDTLCSFDVSTQRRTVTLDEVSVLPSGETLPALAPGGALGLAEKLRELARGEKTATPLCKTLEADAERLENEAAFPTADRWLSLIFPEFVTALDYLPPDALVVILDHSRVSERAKNLNWQAGEDFTSLIAQGLLHPKHAKFYADSAELFSAVSEFPTVFLDSFIGAAYPLPPKVLETFSAKQLPSYGGSLETAVDDVRHYMNQGARTVVLCRDENRARRLMELLFERGVSVQLDYGLSSMPEPGRVKIALGAVSSGFEYPSVGLVLITEGQISAVKKPLGKKFTKTGRQRVQSYSDLTPGDYVVHEHHGIGKFSGIATMEVDGAERDYVKILFLGSAAIYVPATQLDLVSKYIGGGAEDGSVRLNKLGGAEWKKSKTKARAAARELAKELIELYAARRRLAGYPFPGDDDMQRDFETRFEYTETDDQLEAAAEIKLDMQAPFPMDRLLCGDVGFGKTEVALRAVMKCIIAGKQAAILVPTTVLAQQHFLTATRRFAGLPVTVDMMSRFRSPKQIAETKKRLENGLCDLVIGTHSLLAKNVKFKDLGLLIIDEEQRFGVGHKERLKEISKTVDVLTLSATPIPRTLNMALGGIRDMSSLEEAPRDRHPVQTYVLEQEDGILLDAIRREVARGGQVYYLHNRVESIDQCMLRLSRMLNGSDDEQPQKRGHHRKPAAETVEKADENSRQPPQNFDETQGSDRDGNRVSIAVAHGQMAEGELASIMQRLEEGEIQVLVCTTIIETGIDIPNVNTLIVEDADRFGLAQLHQLRGRVGRSQRHAYAYLCFRRGKVLTEIAEKRLNAIREFAEFGAGFKIAMRDLEIRGAGNMLGHAQSGHMMNVGYDMYLKLLEEAVLEERGEAPNRGADCTADLAVSAGIPEKYISDAGQRMDLYRRIALVRSDEDASDLIDELCDRYGDIPKNVHALIRIALLRAAAGALKITEISQKEGRLNFYTAEPDIHAISVLCGEKRWKGRLFFSAGEKPYISLKFSGSSLDEAEALVKSLAL